jgi:stearoyl-CoA desaturase (Delta-9 desaturase)
VNFSYATGRKKGSGQAVNSLGHTYGTQPESRGDQSRNNALFALITFGEGWHNNHHARPHSATNTVCRWEIDLNGTIITLLEKAGIVSHVIRGDRLEHFSGFSKNEG